MAMTMRRIFFLVLLLLVPALPAWAIDPSGTWRHGSTETWTLIR
jgi:hypothetical protein